MKEDATGPHARGGARGCAGMMTAQSGLTDAELDHFATDLQHTATMMKEALGDSADEPEL